MPDIFDLIRVQKKRDILIDKQTEKLISAIEKSYLQAERNLVKAIGKEDAYSLSFILQNKRNIENILLESGYYEAIENYVYEFSGALKDIKESYKMLGNKPKLTEANSTAIKAMTRQTIDQFGTIGQAAGQEIYDGIVKTALSGGSWEDVLNRARSLVNPAEGIALANVRYIATIAQTKYMEYIRTSNEIIADEAGLDRRLYVGPVDSKIRPFCLARVGDIFTVEEIRKMNNGQIPDVLINGGGYNCRHRWIAVDNKFSVSEQNKKDIAELKTERKEAINAE